MSFVAQKENFKKKTIRISENSNRIKNLHKTIKIKKK